MPKVDVHNQAGEKKGEKELPADIFEIEVKDIVIQKAVRAHLANARINFAHTKTRSERRGGGAKPWRQKGTGRARHGSIRSPQWVGGGKAHTPKPRDYSQKMPKKMRRLALRCALSAKARDGEMTVLESLTLDEPKSKEMAQILKVLKVDSTVLVVTSEAKANVVKSARNLPGIETRPADVLNVLDVLSSRTLLMEVAAVRRAEQLWGEKSSEEGE